MKKNIILSAFLLSAFTFSCTVSASTVENDSIGLKMEISDDDQLIIEGNNLTYAMKDEYSWTSFLYENEEIAAVMAITEEADAEYDYHTEFEGIVSDGTYSYTTTNHNGLSYYFLYQNTEENDKKADLIKAVIDAFEQAEYYEPVVPDLSQVSFHAVNLDGEDITESIFQEKDFTVINIWATWCNPCLNELPLLAQWEKELPENVQVLYVDYETEGIAKADSSIIDNIIEKTGISRDHVFLYEEGFSSTIDNLTQAFPTTLFLDKDGNLISDVVVGAYVDRYKDIVGQLLENQ